MLPSPTGHYPPGQTSFAQFIIVHSNLQIEKKVDISWGFLYANNHHRHNKYFQNIINSIIFLQFVFGATR